MAIINELALKELKEIYFTENGVRLANKDATRLANQLLLLFKVLFEFNNEDLQNDLIKLK